MIDSVPLKDAIRLNYLTKGFTEAELDRLYGIAEPEKFEDGDEIVRQFDTTRDLLILASGTAHILTTQGEPIGQIMPGMPMGEVSFLDGKPRSGTAVASGECDVVVLPADLLMQILRESPEMAVKALWNISSVLCARLRTANENLASLMPFEE
ncbi:MAG: cyclic nucleotide-binding domain-containing protein [Fimbriimonas sp.]|nr:cyclic nucleotide-binding domain-containing protein [Fimbriimonas sp.]